MPTYEYVCTECGEHVEVVQSMSDPPLTTCPVCGGQLRKVFSPIGIVFKGSGFYKTDSRGKPVKAGADSGKDKGDKKPAETTPAASSKDGGASSSKPKATEKSA
jgi:putative FmdB family regulatory protein